MGIFYIIVNTITFIAYSLDKQYARKQTFRIKESTLLTFSILGGGLGGYLAMLIANHKTKKVKFHIINIISIILHSYLLLKEAL